MKVGDKHLQLAFTSYSIDACGDGLHFGEYSSMGQHGLPSDWGDE